MNAIGAEVNRVLRAALLASPVRILARCVVLDALIDERVGRRGAGRRAWRRRGVAGRYGDGARCHPGHRRVRPGLRDHHQPGRADRRRPGAGRPCRSGAARPGVRAVSPDGAVAGIGPGPVPPDHRGLARGWGCAGGRGGPASSWPGVIRSATWPPGTSCRRPCSSGWDPGQAITSGWMPPRWGGPRWSGTSPRVVALCRARGIDPVTEPIPVSAPGAHYACGGIRADMDGRTSVPGLYAVGEAASTGVHGANRLASNSLTEALITGRRAGDMLGQDLPKPSARLQPPPAGLGVDPAVRPGMAAAMSRDAGVLRDHENMERLERRLGQAPPQAKGPWGWTWPRSRRPACMRSRSWSLWPPWPGRRAAGATGGEMRRLLCPPRRPAIP